MYSVSRVTLNTPYYQSLYKITKRQPQSITGRTNKMKTIRTKVYQFSELTKEAQDKALCWFIEVLMQFEFPEDSPYMPAIVKNEKSQTPWFIPETLFHEHRDSLIADIEANEYDFTKDGKRFNQ